MEKDINFKIVGDIGSYQMDIMFFDNLKRFNSGYNSLLICIHIPNRKLYIEPLKTKNKEDVLYAFTEIIERMTEPIKSITTDSGKEFNNNYFSEFCMVNNIEI